METKQSVDEYILSSPIETQEKLRQLRKIIKACAPEAQEGLSYGMPFYSFKGRLVYFGLAKQHIGLYIPPPIIEQHSKELKGYTTTKSAVHLPLDKEFSEALIKKLVKARIAWNKKSVSPSRK